MTDHENAIRSIVADVEKGLNTNDIDLMVRHFDPTGHVVDARGRRIEAGPALLEAHEQALAGFLRDQHVRYSVTDVRLLADDVALGHVEAFATDAGGADLDGRVAMVATYVVASRNGTWRVLVRHNTPVAS